MTKINSAMLFGDLICDEVEPRFQVLSRIGHGAFAEVFKAKDLLSGEIVALKRLYMKQRERGESTTASNELAVLTALRHVPHIVHLIDTHRQDGYLSLVLEYCETDLASMIKTKGNNALRHEAATNLLHQILKGLVDVHTNGCMHRDLKPSNILLKNGCIKIADFGQARFVDDAYGRHTPTVTSRWYRAPELLFGSQCYTSAVDIWAVSMIYVELLTGSPFLPGKSDLEQISLMINAFGSINEENWPEVKELPDYGKILFDQCTRPPLSQMFPQIHANAIDFLEKTLLYNPAERLSACECLQHPVFSGMEPETGLAKH